MEYYIDVVCLRNGISLVIMLIYSTIAFDDTYKDDKNVKDFLIRMLFIVVFASRICFK